MSGREGEAEPRLSAAGRYAFFDGMTWPTGDIQCDGGTLVWLLRHGEPSRADLLVAASIVSAYRALIHDKSQDQRNEIVSKIRMAVLGITPQDIAETMPEPIHD